MSAARVHDLRLMIVKIINIVLITASFGVCWLLYYAPLLEDPYYYNGRFIVIAVFMIIYYVCCDIYDALYVSLYRITQMIRGQILAVIVADVSMYFITWVLNKYAPVFWPFVCVFVTQFFISVLWSLYSHKWYFNAFPPKKTLIIYDSRQGLEQLVEEYGLDIKFNLQGSVEIKDFLADMENKTADNEVVFLCGIHSHERNIIIKYCILHNITAYIIPRIGDVIMSGAKSVHLFHLPMMQLNRYHPSIFYVVFKRIFDIFISGLGLIIFFPLMLIVSVIIRLTDKGPVFYRQIRLTKNGRRFVMLKFRSMVVNAEADGVARLSTGDIDGRVTKIGRFIRKVRIDELPQLFNILKGDMSFVGPRPERPEIAKEYEKELPEWKLRLQVKAGLTGYAQVYGKYNSTPYDKLQMDLMYIAKPSFFEDLRIILATIKCLMLPESTEGVNKDSISALDNNNKKDG